MNRNDIRAVIFDKITDWTPYADAYDEKIAQERTDQLLDAILPQVTTIEELETLPVWSGVLDRHGDHWRRGDDGAWWRNGNPTLSGDLLGLGPLTVVWQP